jgi:hypothetical protein
VTAAQRARWLAELSNALEEAQTLLWSLDAADLRKVDVLDLSARLEAARAEVRALRLGRTGEQASQFSPNWTNQLLWDRPIEDCGA